MVFLFVCRLIQHHFIAQWQKKSKTIYNWQLSKCEKEEEKNFKVSNNCILNVFIRLKEKRISNDK